MTIEGDESDPTYENLLVSNICPLSSTVYGLTPDKGYNIVDASVNAAHTQMTIENDQFIGSIDGEDLMITGIEISPEGYYLADGVTFSMSPDKTKMVATAYGTIGSGLHEVYPFGIVFTKK